MPFYVKARNVWRGQVRRDKRTYWRDFGTKKEALDWEAEVRKELKRQETQPTRTVMDWLTFSNSYLDEAKLRFTPKVFQEKLSLCKRVIEFWGNPATAEITPEMVRQYLNSRAQVSASRFNKDRKNLLAMWTWGVNILDLPSNPVAKLKNLPHDGAPQYTPPTEDIIKVLTVTTREERIFLNCYLQTGARRSEIFRWTWLEDINFERKEVRLGTRKTKDGSMEYEWLPMSAELYRELWSWWKDRPVKDSPFVFVSTSNRHFGRPFTTRRRFMAGLCKRAGVPEFGFHALRRYVASVLADTHKVSAKTIQRILRHKNVTTTERYIHNINRDLGAIINLLGHGKHTPGLE